MSELFPNLHSTPPPIVTLRKRFDEAKAAFDAADAHEDESGEAVPTEIARAYELARHRLCREEARLAAMTRPEPDHMSACPGCGSSFVLGNGSMRCPKCLSHVPIPNPIGDHMLPRGM